MEISDKMINDGLKGCADEVEVKNKDLLNEESLSKIKHYGQNINEEIQNNPTQVRSRVASSIINKKLENKFHNQDTPFKQQRLPAWQPILTANTVIPWLFAIGVFFIPFGIFLFNTSNQLVEIEQDYTYCKSSDSEDSCANIIEKNIESNCTCEVQLKINKHIDKSAYFYYGLANFYQNHRKYVRSRNDWQLLGYTDNIDLSSCYPFDKNYDDEKKKIMKVAPCGAIANSMFNDTFELFLDEKKVKMFGNDISWPTDRLKKFKNPKNLDSLSEFTHPPNWKIYLQNLTSGDSTAFENEHLIVWMRSAALPRFRKLYARVDHNQPRFRDGLPAGDYIVKINYNFPVTSFKGKKYIIISNTNWLGGKSLFLGIAYLVTGCVCVLLSITLFVLYKKFGLSERQMTNFNVNTPFTY